MMQDGVDEPDATRQDGSKTEVDNARLDVGATGLDGEVDATRLEEHGNTWMDGSVNDEEEVDAMMHDGEDELDATRQDGSETEADNVRLDVGVTRLVGRETEVDNERLNGGGGDPSRPVVDNVRLNEDETRMAVEVDAMSGETEVDNARRDGGGGDPLRLDGGNGPSTAGRVWRGTIVYRGFRKRPHRNLEEQIALQP